MALVSVELETLVSEPDALATQPPQPPQPPPCGTNALFFFFFIEVYAS